jgi:hypothetical protein
MTGRLACFDIGSARPTGPTLPKHQGVSLAARTLEASVGELGLAALVAFVQPDQQVFTRWFSSPRAAHAA